VIFLLKFVKFEFSNYQVKSSQVAFKMIKAMAANYRTNVLKRCTKYWQKYCKGLTLSRQQLKRLFYSTYIFRFVFSQKTAFSQP